MSHVRDRRGEDVGLQSHQVRAFKSTRHTNTTDQLRCVCRTSFCYRCRRTSVGMVHLDCRCTEYRSEAERRAEEEEMSRTFGTRRGRERGPYAGISRNNGVNGYYGRGDEGDGEALAAFQRDQYGYGMAGVRPDRIQQPVGPNPFASGLRDSRRQYQTGRQPMQPNTDPRMGTAVPGGMKHPWRNSGGGGLS